MQVVLDVGNTDTVLGLFDEGGLAESWRISTNVPRTSDEYLLFLSALFEDRGHDLETLRQAVVGSVVPATTEVLRRTLEKLTPGAVHLVDPSSDLPIRLGVDEPRTVGADRIANTLAAKELFGRDTIVVDLGTATTYDCITHDGVFLGGVIAPGIQAGLDWLGKRTAKLPRVELAPPPRVIGRRTESCIQSGVFFSAVVSMDGIVRRIAEEWGVSDPLVLATGGYAPLLVPYSDAVDRLEPHLTLRGLALAGDHLAARGEDPPSAESGEAPRRPGASMGE